MVTIATYNEPAKAKSLKEKLIAAGVKADVNNEANLQTFAFMSKPQANVKVKVEEQDFERAQALLVKWEAADPEIGAMPELPIAPDRISAAHAQIPHPGARRDSLRAQDFSERVLLPKLPVHLDE